MTSIIRSIKPGVHLFRRVTIGCDTVPSPKAPDGPGGEMISIEAAGRTVVVQVTPGGKRASVTVDGVAIKQGVTTVNIEPAVAG